MKSHDGDIELSVTLDTSGADSDIKKLQKKLESATKEKVGTYEFIVDKKQVEKEVQSMIDNVSKSLEDNAPTITPTINKDEAEKNLEDFNKLYRKYLDALQNDRSWNTNTAPAIKEQLMKQFPKEWEEQWGSIDTVVNSMHKVSDAVDEVTNDVNNLGDTIDESFDSDSTDKYIMSLDEIKNKIMGLYEGYDKGTTPSYVVQDQIKYLMEDVNELSVEEQDAFDKWYADLQKTRQASEELAKAQEQAVSSSEDTIPEANVEKYTSTIKDAREQLKTLANDFLIMKEGFHYSDDFVRLKKDAEYLTKALNGTNEKLRQMELEGATDTEQYAKMVEKANNLSIALQHVVMNMKIMREDGSAFEEGIDPEQLQQAEKVYNSLASKMALMCKEKPSRDCPDEKMKSLKDNALKAIPAIKKLASSILKMGAGNIMRSFNTIGKAFKGITNHAMQFARQSGRMFRLRDILAYAIGIRSLFSLFTKLRGYVTEGTKNLALWRDGNNKVNKSLSDLTSSLTYMKNAWGAAFSPILTIVTPVLDKLIQAIADAANALSYLFAKLTGQSTWYKAIRVQKDYAKSLNGTAGAASKAEQKLAAYDKLVMVDTDKGGGGASADVNSMFEEVPIENAIESVDDFLDKLKEAWANADFTDIGNILGLKLKDALDGIPWDYIKEFARKLAHSIATLLNGFFETEGLAESIGRTIAEAFNTIFSFVDEFVHTLHWDSIGEFIGESLFSFIKNFDAELAGSAIGGAIRGLIDTFYSAVTTFAEGDGEIGGFELLGQKISDFINAFIEEMDRLDEEGKSGWVKLGESIHTSISGIFTSIQTAIEGVSAEDGWKKIGTGIGEIIKKIDFVDLGLELADTANSIIQALADAITSFAKTAPLETAILGVITAAATLAVAGGIEISGVTLVLVAATAVLGFNLGEVLGETLFPDDAIWYEEFSWEKLFNENSLEDILAGLGLMVEQFFANAWGTVSWFFNNALNTVAFFFTNAWNTVKLFFTNAAKPVEWLWSKISWFFDNALILVKVFFTNAWTTVSLFLGIAYRTIKFAVDKIWGFVSTLGEDIWGGLCLLSDDIAFWWDELWADISAWSDDITLWWSEILEGVKGFVADCQFWFDDMITNIKTSFAGMLNSIIDGINSLIDKINTLDIDFTKMGLPSAVTDILGGKIDINLAKLSHVSVPGLAQGAVIPPNKQFLAMLGDQKSGVNIETPLDTMVEAFKIAMEDFGGNNNQPIVLQLDGRTIAQAVWDEDRKKYRQTKSYSY